MLQLAPGDEVTFLLEKEILTDEPGGDLDKLVLRLELASREAGEYLRFDARLGGSGEQVHIACFHDTPY